MSETGGTTRWLLLMRHAKSSWKDHSLADHDRPLNKRGRRDAPRMGARLGEAGLVPQVIVSSTAERARETAELLAAGCVPVPRLTFLRELYHGDDMDYERAIRQVDDACRCLLVIGHNPGLEEIIARVSHESCRMPTAAIAVLELDLSRWDAFRFGTPVVGMEIWCPKDGDSDDGA
ncbi:MAG: histidine phosphatase family protein [Phycisphaerales bacterium]|nr:histidine phosphatase family protein [Phycisphaerales bacterium]